MGRRKHHGAERKSGVDDSDSDTGGQCDVISAKAGCGVWGLCHVFENTLSLHRDLMEDSAVPSNLSIPRYLSQIRLPLLLGQEGPQARAACSIFPHEAGPQQGHLL